MESKLHLYNRVISSRDGMSEAEVIEVSRVIQKRLIQLEEFHTALRVGLYVAFKNEVRTDMLFQDGDIHRKEMYYPAIDPSNNSVSYFRIKHPNDLFPNNEGFIRASATHSKLRDLNTLNVIVVTGVAFDLKGGRMGYGKGFYDKSLEKFRGKRIALAFDFQVVDELPTKVMGRRIDCIVTEKRTIRF